MVGMVNNIMDDETALAEQLYQLETSLLQPEVRASAQAVADLLADEFVEFGSSGRVSDKAQIIAALKDETGLKRTMTDFKIKRLAADVVLVTYHITRYVDRQTESAASLRSSIWRKTADRWQMVFHQGTAST